MVINGFSAILFNLVMLPALAFLNFYLLEEVVWLAVPILLVLILAFVLMLPGYFSQEPNEARVMVFFGKYEGTFKRTGFYWVNPFMNKKKLLEAGLPNKDYFIYCPFPLYQRSVAMRSLSFPHLGTLVSTVRNFNFPTQKEAVSK